MIYSLMTGFTMPSALMIKIGPGRGLGRGGLFIRKEFCSCRNA